jgi:hypothetical protein
MTTQTAATEFEGLPPGSVVGAHASANGRQVYVTRPSQMPRLGWLRRQPRAPRQERDRSAGWLRNAMIALGVLAVVAAIVSYAAQYKFVLAAKKITAIAALEAGIPDAAAVIFACLGIALALQGRRAVRARVLNVGAVATSIFMNFASASGLGWRDVAIWTMPPVAYALASDTAIGVVRAWAIARQKALNAALADDEPSPLAMLGRVALYTLRLIVAPPSTARGARCALLNATPLPRALTAPAEQEAIERDHAAAEARAEDAQAETARIREDAARDLDQLRAAGECERGEIAARLAESVERERAAQQRLTDEAAAHAAELERARAETQARIESAVAGRDAAVSQAAAAQRAAENSAGRAAAEAREAISQARADAAREREELREVLDSRARALEEARDELRGRAERAERDLGQARDEVEPGAGPVSARPRRPRPQRQGETKTAAFLRLVEETHGPLAGFPLVRVSRTAAELAPRVGLHPGSARAALKAAVIAATDEALGGVA